MAGCPPCPWTVGGPCVLFSTVMGRPCQSKDHPVLPPEWQNRFRIADAGIESQYAPSATMHSVEKNYGQPIQPARASSRGSVQRHYSPATS